MIKIILYMVLVSALMTKTSAAQGMVSQPIGVQTLDGQIVCNESAALSQIPGHTDFFVGRGWGIGTYDYCHHLPKHSQSFLALFKMDWQRHLLVMQHYLIKTPVKTPSGIKINAAYDPYVTRYKGVPWVAMECTVPGAVSACMAPLRHDLSSFDLSRLTVPVIGKIGPYGPNNQIVGILSASAPTLLNYEDKLYLYWQIDPIHNELPQNVLITRGMQLEEDSHGRMWGVGSGGKSVKTDDPYLTFLVNDIIPNDQTANHVALISDLFVVGHKILAISSIGGTAGPQVCRSTHDISPGCWRYSLSIADAPLGYNVFGKHLLPSNDLPANVVEYPRLMTGPSGQCFLLGNFLQPKAAPLANRAPLIITKGLLYIPFDENRDDEKS